MNNYFKVYYQSKKKRREKITLAVGLEPTISSLGGKRLIH